MPVIVEAIMRKTIFLFKLPNQVVEVIGTIGRAVCLAYYIEVVHISYRLVVFFLLKLDVGKDTQVVRGDGNGSYG